VLHWNGSAWSRVTSPDVGNAQTVLKDVVALSPTNAWAVGYTNSFGGGASAVALHWNGTSWTVASAPALGTLDTITALSATDIWASGTDSTGATQLANWRGTSWTTHAGARRRRLRDTLADRHGGRRSGHGVGGRLGVGRHERDWKADGLSTTNG
jgi:hypothetical protein